MTVINTNLNSVFNVTRQVIDGMTSGAAYASYDEQRKGTLKAGMLAN